MCILTFWYVYPNSKLDFLIFFMEVNFSRIYNKEKLLCRFINFSF
jgi:hypothetical protein